MANEFERRQRRERLQHVFWAGLIALVLALVKLDGPINEMSWIVQANLAEFEASGDIVFVGSERDMTDPHYPERREELARAIDNLRAAGARSIYLDMAFEEPSRPESDRALNEALRNFGGEAFLIRNVKTDLLAQSNDIDKVTSAVGRGVSQVGAERPPGLFEIVWTVPLVVEHHGKRLIGAPARMVGEDLTGTEGIPVNYGINARTIPRIGLSALLAPSTRDTVISLQGKTVVFGNSQVVAGFRVPGSLKVPGGMIHILAAETLKAGSTQTASVLLLFPLSMIILISSLVIRNPTFRRASYVLLVFSIPGLVIAMAYHPVRLQLGASAVLVTAYLCFRLRSKWKQQTLLTDQETGLATFFALERNKQVARTHPTIIVAKMHRFEEVRQTLPALLHAEYIMRIADRLKAASPDTKIYLGPSHAVAWCAAEDDPAVIKDHLEGLRALFAVPLLVGNQQVDVGMTFGVDISPSRDMVRRLASAVAAAERTAETYHPIVIAETRSDEELIWNISLQARIDAALEQGEIFLVYQPKIRIGSGDMVGMEALVRWRDPARGMIPPDQFISQCEDAGRMGHLTRYVLRSACESMGGLDPREGSLSIAVNLSATLLHETGLVAMIREVLTETAANPAQLTLEVTETYRISDIDAARFNLEQLADMGITISMDDFGVGAASFEALLCLPFDELKIDRLFIDLIVGDPKARAIMCSILELGRRLGISVVAEGVEDAATLDLLRNAGCPLAQGFGICRPVALEEAVQFRNSSRKLKIG